MSVDVPQEVRARFGDAKVVRVADGTHHHAALLSDGRVVCWGDNGEGQCDVPADLGPCKAVAVGWYHTVALTEDGRVLCWGDIFHGECNVPADLGPCKAVAAVYYHTAALTEDGRLRRWGDLELHEPLPTELTATMTDDAWLDFAVREYPRCHEAVFPARIRALPEFRKIRAMHSLTQAVHASIGDATLVQVADVEHHHAALLSDGRVVCWGDNGEGQCDVPADLGPCKAVAVGYAHTAALTEDGRVLCWGDSFYGECNVPADLGPCKAVEAGWHHTVALTEDGRVVCWGTNVYLQCEVPADLGPCKAVAAVYYHTAALTEDGRLRRWGVLELDEPLPTELTATMTDDAWLDFAVREYPRCNDDVFPERIRALPQFEAIRAMHRLVGG